MCGRFAAGHLTQAAMQEIVEGFLQVTLALDPDAHEVRPSWNVKPTQYVQIMGQRDNEFLLTSARWWFVPHWHKGDVKDFKLTTFNAKIETAASKPVFRTAWSSSRCAIPALGFYEWTGPKTNRQPNYITVETNSPLVFFAGLHSRLNDGTRTCTILTRDPSPQIAHIHNRMPVLLSAAEITPWITGDISTTDAQENLGTSWEGRFKFHPVKKMARDSEGPELIEPID